MIKRLPLLLTVILSIAMFLLTTQAFASQGTMVNPNAQPLTIHVGWVTEYTPGASITIQTHDGSFFTYIVNESTKILPANRASELAVGSRVTIISPNGDPAAGTAVAAGIVVHPAGSGEGSMPPAATNTPVPTGVVTETPIATETPGATETPLVTETPGVTETPPVTETPGGTTPTPTPGLVFPVAINTGLVTEYTAGASLTIQTDDALLHTYVLSPSLTILPSAGDLMVGARVTVVAFHDMGTGNWVAFGIVVQSSAATPTP
jgi:hypothetical protein